MDIYFSCSITGGRADQPVYAALVAALQSAGHQVLTAALAAPNLHEEGSDHAAADIYARDVAWLRQCQAVIAEVTTPSHGVGFEIAYAQQLPRPVLCLHAAGRRVSKMLTGNPHITVRAYHSVPEACALALAFAQGLSRAA